MSQSGNPLDSEEVAHGGHSVHMSTCISVCVYAVHICMHAMRPHGLYVHYLLHLRRPWVERTAEVELRHDAPQRPHVHPPREGQAQQDLWGPVEPECTTEAKDTS